MKEELKKSTKLMGKLVKSDYGCIYYFVEWEKEKKKEENKE